MKKILTESLKNSVGLGLIEIVLAVAIVSGSFIAILAFFLFSQNSTFKAQHNAEADSLNEQAIEAVRKLRDDSWSTNISPLTNGSTYYTQLSGNKWILTTTNPNTASYYTTKIIFSAVNRDSSSNIVTSGGSIDANTRKVVTTTTWTESKSQSSVDLTTYITNFNNN